MCSSSIWDTSVVCCGCQQELEYFLGNAFALNKCHSFIGMWVWLDVVNFLYTDKSWFRLFVCYPHVLNISNFQCLTVCEFIQGENLILSYRPPIPFTEVDSGLEIWFIQGENLVSQVLYYHKNMVSSQSSTETWPVAHVEFMGSSASLGISEIC